MAMPRVRSTSESPPVPERSMWTFADLEQLPDDGNRYEILHGELLVTPLPAHGHQAVSMRLALKLGAWCAANPGWSVRAFGGVYVRETLWFEPDIAVYPTPEYLELPWKEMPPPMLAVEVLSSATRARDRHRKRPEYIRHGVGEVWLVDRDTRLVERWTAASEFPETHVDGIAWTPDAALPTLSIALDELFGPNVE